MDALQHPPFVEGNSCTRHGDRASVSERTWAYQTKSAFSDIANIASERLTCNSRLSLTKPLEHPEPPLESLAATFFAGSLGRVRGRPLPLTGIHAGFVRIATLMMPKRCSTLQPVRKGRAVHLGAQRFRSEVLKYDASNERPLVD
jgi:hypothetical protein